MAKVFPTASQSEAESIQSPIFCIVADSTTTAAVINLSAWADRYVTLVMVGDDGAIAVNDDNSIGSYTYATRSSTAANTQTNCMMRLIEGQPMSFVVSPQYPYLVHRTATGTAVICVSRS